MRIERKIQVMGVELVSPSSPLANFLPIKRTGNTIYVAGHLPLIPNGDLIFPGKVGGQVSVEQAYDAARQATINCLASIKESIGDLDYITQVIKLLVMINATPEFERHFIVANGASDLLVELYGNIGQHSRSAVGMSSLPRGSCVEVEMIVEVSD